MNSKIAKVLSLLLALFVALTMCNIAVSADTYVARVGETQYTTLAAAIAAANEMSNATVTLLRDYDMESNEPGYGWTTQSHSARENFLMVTGSGLTFDLGGHTLSNLFNNTFKISGNNITVQNGEMRVGKYTDNTNCSYVMITDNAQNFTVNNLVTFGGINVAGGSTVEINNLSFSGTSFYAVCSQENSTVTLNGGTYSKAVPGASNSLFWVEKESTINITGGTYTKGSANFRNEKVNPVITGGTFDFDPSSFGVASGYKTVNNGNGTYSVMYDGIGRANFSFSLAPQDEIMVTFHAENLQDGALNAESNPNRFKVEYTFKGVTKTKTLTKADDNVVVVAKCAAKDLDAPVDVTVYYDDYPIHEESYSAKSYCDATAYNYSAPAKLKTLCETMENFAGISQARFNNYSAIGWSIPDTTIPAGVDVAGVHQEYYVAENIRASLVLESKTKLKIYFDSYNPDVVVKVNDKKATVILTEFGGYYIAIPNISITDLDKTYTVDFYEYGETEPGTTLTYSPLSYLERMQNDDTESDICKAMYNYYVAAEAYIAD